MSPKFNSPSESEMFSFKQSSENAARDVEEADKKRQEREKHNSPQAQADRLEEMRKAFQNESKKDQAAKKNTADAQRAAQLRNQINDLIK